MADKLLVIDAPGHFYCGVILCDGRVIKAAPIVGYMRGKSKAWVFEYARRRRWRSFIHTPKDK